MNLLPEVTEQPRDAGLPLEASVSPDVAAAALQTVLRREVWWRDDTWAALRALAAAAQLRVRGGYVEVRLDARTYQGGVWIPTEGAARGDLGGAVCMACHGQGTCQHVVAAALAVMWSTPDGRRALQGGVWRELLAPLRRTPAAAAADERGRGFIRCVLHDQPAEDPRGLAAGMLTLDLVRLSKRSDTPLKPKRAPRSLAAVERQVRDLPPGDRRLCRLAEQRWLLGHVHNYRYSDSSSVSDEIQRLDAEAFAALGEVSEVWFEDAQVEVSAEGWVPTLTVRDREAGGLTLAAGRDVLAIWPVGPGYVLTADNRLRRVAPGVPPEAVDLLWRPLPPIPPEDVDAFVAEFLPTVAVRLDLRSDQVRPETWAPAPVLHLTEEGGALTMRARFAYGDVEVAAEDPAAVLRVEGPDGPRVVRRDAAAEGAALAALGARLPAPYPMQFGDEDAVNDFLLDVVPLLEGWSVYLDEALRARKPRGTLRPSVRFSEGADWFDLEVAFELEDAAVKPAEVLRSWREGRRYVRLPDGTVARLPADWLRRHGERYAELSDLGSGRGKRRLGAYAAPLAAELIGEAAAAEQADRWRDVADRIQRFERVPERAPPKGLTAQLRDYQLRGYRWLAALDDLGLGGVLADDMGLGKTLQTLALLIHTHCGSRGSRKSPPSLVVAPTSVVHNWVEEARRFAPGLRVALYHGTNRGAPPEDAQVVVTSYAILRQDAEALTARGWRHVVLDEAQQIKNPQSQVAQVARQLQAKHRLALTGTPIENHLAELWSLFQFLNPGFFGSQRAFTERYQSPIQREQDEDALRALRRRIRPFVLRRLKSEVAAELPPRQEQVLRCELSPAQRKLYDGVRETYREAVLGKVEAEGVGRATIQVLEALMRLRQACCDPRLLPFVEARGVQASAKMEALAELLEDMLEEGHRALVFSQWPSLLKLVAADLLDARGIPYLYLDGATKERGELQAQWNRPDGPPLFLISLKAGGTGLNLTGADHVIHLDPWWNPAVEQQATDRAHRIGQTKPVMVYKLVAADTVEEKILELQARKKALADAAVDADRMLVEALTREDLEAVFAPGDAG